MSRFIVVTDAGIRVSDNHTKGFDEKEAEADAKERNERAEKLGIKVRYEVAEYSGTAK